MPDPESDQIIDFSVGAGTVPLTLYSERYLREQQTANPDLRIMAIASTFERWEMACWYRYGQTVFFGSFAALKENNLKAYVISQ